MNINTHCNGCVFAVCDINGQCGCKLNRAEKLEITEKNNDGFFVLNRFCSTYRPNSWLEDLSVKESENITETVLNEVVPRIGFFVILDTEKENAIHDLDKTLTNIKDQTLNPRYVIVITDKVEYNEEINTLFNTYFDFNITKYHIVQLIIKPEVLSHVIDEAFKHAKNGWAYVCHSGENIDTHLIEKIHKRVNIDLKRLSVVKPYDENLNGLLFQTALFKFLNGNSIKIFQDNITDSRTFIQKVESAATKSDKETLLTWEEFNAS